MHTDGESLLKAKFSDNNVTWLHEVMIRWKVFFFVVIRKKVEMTLKQEREREREAHTPTKHIQSEVSSEKASQHFSDNSKKREKGET